MIPGSLRPLMHMLRRRFATTSPSCPSSAMPICIILGDLVTCATRIGLSWGSISSCCFRNCVVLMMTFVIWDKLASSSAAALFDPLLLLLLFCSSWSADSMELDGSFLSIRGHNCQHNNTKTDGINKNLGAFVKSVHQMGLSAIYIYRLLLGIWNKEIEKIKHDHTSVWRSWSEPAKHVLRVTS